MLGFEEQERKIDINKNRFEIIKLNIDSKSSE